jgi:hypothetical protein
MRLDPDGEIPPTGQTIRDFWAYSDIDTNRAGDPPCVTAAFVKVEPDC